MSDKIQRFDRPTAAKFGTELHELTSSWAQAQGVELQRRSAVFSPEASTYKVTLTFHEIAREGRVGLNNGETISFFKRGEKNGVETLLPTPKE